MATKAETNAVYAAGLIQGITLVTFPAASTIFTDPSQYGLSNTHQATHLSRQQRDTHRIRRRIDHLTNMTV
jgi:hypothetical protein